MKPSSSIAMSALIAAGLAAMPAQAVTQTRTVTTPGARLCTLSIPTTDTKVRPKATGFLNEGTTNAFVICAVDSSPGQVQISAAESTTDPSYVALIFSSIDGAPHSFSCTGVNSWPSGGQFAPMHYVQKTVAIDPLSDPFVQVTWGATDFGGTTHIPTSGVFSVTCLLPPGAAILFSGTIATEDVGS